VCLCGSLPRQLDGSPIGFDRQTEALRYGVVSRVLRSSRGAKEDDFPPLGPPKSRGPRDDDGSSDRRSRIRSAGVSPASGIFKKDKNANETPAPRFSI